MRNVFVVGNVNQFWQEHLQDIGAAVSAGVSSLIIVIRLTPEIVPLTIPRGEGMPHIRAKARLLEMVSAVKPRISGTGISIS